MLYLARHTDEDLDTVLEQESGLLGLAGTARHARGARAAAGPAIRTAQFALDVWLHRFLREAGGCVAVLGGLDVLVFTGGVGENSGEVRALVAARLAWLGVAVADGTAEGPVADVTAPGAAVRSLVVHAREDLQMIAEAGRLLGDEPAAPSGSPAAQRGDRPAADRAGDERRPAEDVGR